MTYLAAACYLSRTFLRLDPAIDSALEEIQG